MSTMAAPTNGSSSSHAHVSPLMALQRMFANYPTTVDKAMQGAVEGAGAGVLWGLYSARQDSKVARLAGKPLPFGQGGLTVLKSSGSFSLYFGVICGASSLFLNLQALYRVRATPPEKLNTMIEEYRSSIHTPLSLAVGGATAGTILGVVKRSKHLGTCAFLSALLSPAYGQMCKLIIQ